MRIFCILALCAGTLPAQTAAEVPPLVRGVLLERDTNSPTGEFSVRAADNRVYRFQFDRKTYVERDDQLIEVKRLDPGEKVEVVSDIVPGLILRYARTVHVMPESPPRPVARLRPPRTALDGTPPTGNLSFSGIVLRLTGERILLHTREGGDQSLLLRKDTRYLENGASVDAEDLKPSTRVFIRAGKDVYDRLEAYQVIWGTILEPR